MRRKYMLLTGFIAIGLTFYSFTGNQAGKVYFTKAGDTTINCLALYGEYIFKREKCANCHSFSQTADKSLVTLDGLQGKFSNYWHYLHLQDPPSITVESKMPSFEHLTQKFISKDTLRLIIPSLDDSKWSYLLEQADSILQDLKKFEIIIDRKSEMIALIAYLQSIPETEELKRINREEANRLAKQKKRWDSLMMNSMDIIYKTINEKSSIESGKDIFQSICFPCHGQEGEGVVGPNLTDDYWLHGANVKSLVNTIVYGITDKGMPAWLYQLNPTDVGS